MMMARECELLWIQSMIDVFLRLATSLADVDDKSLRTGALQQDIKTI